MTSQEEPPPPRPATPVRATVPPHGAETLPWAPRSGRRAEIDEYDATIPPQIADLDVSASAELLERSTAAQIEIAVLERTFSDQVATLEPFTMRTEAIASSRIEEEVTTVDQLARAQYGIRALRTARTVKGAVDGLHLLVSRAGRGVTIDDILAAHRPLMAGDAEEKWDAGKLRTVQNWIGGSHRSPRGALHVPPVHQRVPGLMDDLVAFMRRTDIDPIVQGAIAHVQFESIHPFTDGNGRIGRSLMNALWRYRGVTATVAIPIASAIVADRERYFDLIDAYRTGEVEPFALYLADATLRCAREAGVSAQRLAELPEQWARRARPRAGSTAARLLPLLTRHPVVDAGDVVRLTGSSSTAAYTAIDTLVDAEVLRPLTESRRDMVWAAGDVLDEADVMVDRLRG